WTSTFSPPSWADAATAVAATAIATSAPTRLSISLLQSNESIAPAMGRSFLRARLLAVAEGAGQGVVDLQQLDEARLAARQPDEVLRRHAGSDGRRGLDLLGRELDDLLERVAGQADQASLALHLQLEQHEAARHSRARLAQPVDRGQVHHRDHRATQVDHAADRAGRAGDARDRLGLVDLLDPGHGHAHLVAVEPEGHVAGARAHESTASSRLREAPDRASSAPTSRMSATRPLARMVAPAIPGGLGK